MFHKNAVITDIHMAHNWEYANAAARLAATGFVAGDLKKLALQLDNSSLWLLTAATPTWVEIGAANKSNTVAGWAADNPVLATGVIGYETDTTKFKIGDGTTAWNTLSHWRYVPEHITVTTTGGTTVLTEEQNKATSLATAGLLTNNAIIVVNNTMAPFVAENGNTGAFTTTFKTAAGTGVALAQITHQLLYADGVNVEAASSAGAGSGDALVANPLSQFAATTSAQLAGVISDETGSGALVFANSPTLVTPALGTPASGSLVNCTITTHNVGNSTNLDTFLANIDASQTAHANTGFSAWGGAGNYYSIATNQLTLLRAGEGFINSKKIAWAAPQTAAAFTAYAAHWIYIDANGTVGISTSRTRAFYAANIILFEVYYDGTGYEVVWENHSVTIATAEQEYIHSSHGTILTAAEGTSVIGADMVRVATGTGAAAADRQIKIVGAAEIHDAGLITTLPDSAGAAITWKFYYTNGAGQWVEYSGGTDFPMFYNAAGTMTAIGTTGATDHAIWTCYAIKGEPNAGTPIYIAVADTTRYATSAAAQAGISLGSNAQMAGVIFNALEPAQLGQVILFNNGSGGYIEDVMISKSTAHSGTSTGGATSASGITTNTVNFLGALTAADANVQFALETLDRVERQNASIASAATTELNGQAGYAHVTGSVTITSFGTQVAGGLHHLVFDGAPLITHNATSLILPGGVNIQASAGDILLLRSEGNGTGTGSSGTYWRCVGFVPAAVTGTGATVKATSPTLVTPILGVATATSVNGCTLTSGTLNGSVTGTNTGDNTVATALTGAPTIEVTAINLGHASDTTLTRSAAGVLAVESVVIPSISSTNTLTNKRITSRASTEADSATPTINTDNVDKHSITALTTAITSMTTNLTGTPVNGDSLIIEITGTAARAITWGASFESSTVTLPSTTVTTAMLTVGFLWNAATSKWRCVAAV